MSDNFTRTAFAALLAGLLIPTTGQAASAYTFRTINNNGDPVFNQLLGINNAGIIAGYFGDGNAVPNNGYVVAPPYGRGNFTAENFPGAAQTQVIGISDNGTTAGFFVDQGGFDNFGFIRMGSTFIKVSNPNALAAPFVTQLLGVNDLGDAVGFYVGVNNAQSFGYINGSFVPIGPPGAVTSVATGLDGGTSICGYLTLSNGNTEGYYLKSGSFTEFEVPGSTNTMFFGLNGRGLVVGSYVDANGLTNGLIYDANTGTYRTVNDPLASPISAFGVNGTFINGINNAGSLVGFYSDGTKVNGFLATATPEPSSIGLVGLAAALGTGFFYRRKQRQTS